MLDVDPDEFGAAEAAGETDQQKRPIPRSDRGVGERGVVLHRQGPFLEFLEATKRATAVRTLASLARIELGVDRHVAAPGVYQDVGGSGSDCSCVVGEAGSDDNRRLGGDRQRRSFDLQPERRGPVDEHPSLSWPLPAAQPRQMPQKATASSSRVCMSAVGWSGTAGSTRSSWTRRGHRLATYALSGPDRLRFRRYQRLTPVVALRIHRPEVRS